MENELGIKAYADFGKYLGVPITTDKRNTRAFNFIIDKLCSKLSSWKACSLSLARHLTLINTITTAIPTHVMQCTLLPTKVCKEMDKINRNFLWGETTQKRKIHLLSWQTVMTPKRIGGLGIKKSLHRSKAFLAKRLWHIRTNPNELHTFMLKNKYP